MQIQVLLLQNALLVQFPIVKNVLIILIVRYVIQQMDFIQMKYQNFVAKHKTAINAQPMVILVKTVQLDII